MSCYNTKCADDYAVAQDDKERKHEEFLDAIEAKIAKKDKDVIERITNAFYDAISDENAQKKHEALERIFLSYYLEYPFDDDSQAICNLDDLV